eukprot:scaffold1228_cov119-Cylindrotheca_fusiformis.AAC.7
MDFPGFENDAIIFFGQKGHNHHSLVETAHFVGEIGGFCGGSQLRSASLDSQLAPPRLGVSRTGLRLVGSWLQQNRKTRRKRSISQEKVLQSGKGNEKEAPRTVKEKQEK